MKESIVLLLFTIQTLRLHSMSHEHRKAIKTHETSPCESGCKNMQGRALVLTSDRLLAGEADGKAIYDLEHHRLFVLICCKAYVQCHWKDHACLLLSIAHIGG